MRNEYEALLKNETWILVPLSSYYKILLATNVCLELNKTIIEA